jgi:hypothetical protein
MHRSKQHIYAITSSAGRRTIAGIGAAAVFVHSPIPTRRDGVILAVASRSQQRTSSAPISFTALELLHDIGFGISIRQTNNPW